MATTITPVREKRKPHVGFHVRTPPRFAGCKYTEGSIHYTHDGRITKQEALDRLSDSGYSSIPSYLDHCRRTDVQPFYWLSPYLKQRSPQLGTEPRMASRDCTDPESSASRAESG